MKELDCNWEGLIFTNGGHLIANLRLFCSKKQCFAHVEHHSCLCLNVSAVLRDNIRANVTWEWPGTLKFDAGVPGEHSENCTGWLLVC